MIEARRAQLSDGDGLVGEEVTDLWDDWMRPADQVLDDDQLRSTVYEALAKRRPKSRPAADWAHRPKSFYDCSCSSTSATGAMKWWSARYAPTWFTVPSRG